jgi:hypothetical protein
MITLKEKPTKATFKSFVNRYRSNPKCPLFIKVKSEFNGMIDGKEYYKNAEFHPIVQIPISLNPHKNENDRNHNLNIEGIYLVNGSRDYFQPYEDETMIGYSCDNSCGSFIVAVKKSST